MSDSTQPDTPVDERRNLYGDPLDHFEKVARIWSALLDIEVQTWQVPLLMASLKMVRTMTAPDYSDNSTDLRGYVQIFEEIMGSDMVQASTPAEYRSKKWG